MVAKKEKEKASEDKSEKKKGKFFGLIKHCSCKLLRIANFLSPFASLGVRFWIAAVFWSSGALKFQSWDTTLMLFEYEHPLPIPFTDEIVDPQLAAISGTFFELVMPILIIIGLATRLAVIPLIIMTVTIQYTYMNSADHIIWFMLLTLLLLQGAGRFSWDFLIVQCFAGECPHKPSTASKTLSIVVVTLLTIFAIHEILTLLIDSWNSPWWDSLTNMFKNMDAWLGGLYRDT